MDLEGQPAQPSDLGWELQEEKERGHSQEKSPRSSEARAANGATDPGLQLGPPSVRKGSGESYPDPSETERKDKRKNDKTSELRWDTQTQIQRRDNLQNNVNKRGSGFRETQRVDRWSYCGM